MKPARLDSRLIMHRGANVRFQTRIGEIESSSSLIRAYQPHMIVGALQTPDYALAVFAANAARPSAPKNGDPGGPLPPARRGVPPSVDSRDD